MDVFPQGGLKRPPLPQIGLISNPFYSEELVVRAGSENPRLITAKERKIQEVFVHPEYDNITFYFDLALIVLREVYNFCTKVKFFYG